MTEEQGGRTHLQVGAGGEHTRAVHGLDGVAVERRGGSGDDWRLGGGREGGQRLGHQERSSL